MNGTKNPYTGYRYPAEIISHALWLSFRFTLSYRDAGIQRLVAGTSRRNQYRQGAGSNPSAMPSGFSPPVGRSTISSTSVAIG